MPVHPKHPKVRRVWIAVEGLALAAALAWLGLRAFGGPDLSVRLAEVGGYTDQIPIWMRFTFTLDITNHTSRTIGIVRVDVEPDFDDFNEAYGQAVPVLTPPLLIEGGNTTRHTALVTLLNAAQLPERTYDVVFRVRVETEDGDTVTQDFPARFEHSQDPARRVLRR